MTPAKGAGTDQRLNQNGLEPELSSGGSASSVADPIAALGDRLGQTTLRQRLDLEAAHTKKKRIFGSRPSLFSRSAWKRATLWHGLHALGLYERGYRNFKDVQVRSNRVMLPALPQAFDGYRILHLSDLHIDLDTSLTDVIIDRVGRVSYDLCVITGDFRSETFGPSDLALTETARLVTHLRSPIFAILGNHDYVETVPPLEAAGVQFLLNETVPIQRYDTSIYLSGIDDPYFYKTEDIFRASRAIPTDAISVLLSHTPDVYPLAAAEGYDLLLCGHTHAGQLCFPGGHAIQRNIRSPRHMTQGPWRYRQMAGYTSAGTGATNLPIRFFCPPEITLHELCIDDSIAIPTPDG